MEDEKAIKKEVEQVENESVKESKTEVKPKESSKGEDTPKKETKPESNPLIDLVSKYFPKDEITKENVAEFALKAIQKLASIQDKLKARAEEEPELAYFLNDILKGMQVDEAIARNFDPSIMNPPEGAPDWERINAGSEERKKKLSERKKREEQLASNTELTVENAQAFIQETGLEEKDAMAFLDWYDKLHADMFDGLISKEHFAALYKAYTHDNVVAEKDKQIGEAREEGEIAGLNKQIEKRNRTAEQGDGVPKLNGGAEKVRERKKTYGESFFEGVI